MEMYPLPPIHERTVAENPLRRAGKGSSDNPSEPIMGTHQP